MAKLKPDRRLGMHRPITRRDFLNGFALALSGSLLPASSSWLEGFGLPQSPFAPEKQPDYYPPSLTGMRGSHDGSWEVAHALRDGAQWPHPTADPGAFDLIIVGGGISGLAAAYFFRQRVLPKARILILENHDDFGGHAKRNEFRAPSRILLGYGGTQSIASPGLYSPQAAGLLRDLGVDTSRFYKYFDTGFAKAHSLSSGMFFDQATFGSSRLVAGRDTLPPAEFLSRTPLSPQVRKDLLRLLTAKVDYLPGISPREKKILLARTSYKDFLLLHARVDPGVITVLQRQTAGLYGVGIDAVPAGDLAGLGFPGFEGMDLSGPPGPGLGLEVTRQDPHSPYIFHFPDGNASLARLLVRSLIPGSAPGHTMEDIVTARMHYPLLDQEPSPVRIRLNSTAILARNLGEPGHPSQVEVVYVRGGAAHSVRAPAAILACWNMVIPYLCPELPEPQKQALAYGVKVPLVYANVLIRNWESFRKLGVSHVHCPGSYFESVSLDFPVSMGGYSFPSNPAEPCLLHLERAPCKPGLPAREQQIAGRFELFTTPFDTFERHIRSQLAAMLSPAGFDPARDILAITVNRWPHGYAYEYNSLFDPDWPAEKQPCVIGRQPFGRISIANSDAGAFAYTNAAIDQAWRAVSEVSRFFS